MMSMTQWYLALVVAASLTVCHGLEPLLQEVSIQLQNQSQVEVVPAGQQPSEEIASRLGEMKPASDNVMIMLQTENITLPLPSNVTFMNDFMQNNSDSVEAATKLVDQQINSVKELQQNVTPVVQENKNKFEELLDQVAKDFEQVKDAGDQLVDAIKDTGNAVGDVAKDVVDTVVETAKDVGKAIGNFFSDLFG